MADQRECSGPSSEVCRAHRILVPLEMVGYYIAVYGNEDILGIAGWPRDRMAREGRLEEA